MSLWQIHKSERMKIIENTERDNKTNAAIDVMKNNMQYANEPEVGFFWYNVGTNSLFDVYSTPCSDAVWYQSTMWNTSVRTDKRLHQDVWKRKKRSGDHTMIPIGRIFEFKDDGFKICVGDWIKKYPQAIPIIINEFNLPSENTEVIIDSHWDIGHGWSQEMM